MSEPIARRNMLVDYRITGSKCTECGKEYFPPKSFCDKEGRMSKMVQVDHFYEEGTFYSGTVISAPTNKFRYLDTFMSGVFDIGGIRVPGRVTDVIPKDNDDSAKYMGRPVTPRFRRNYADGEDGLVYYSSLNFTFADEYYPHQEYKIRKPSKEIGKAGIVGYGAYLPRYRIKNEGADGVLGVKERTLPFADEDTTTFSVESGKRALIHAGLDSSLVMKVHVGTESPTYAVKPIIATTIQALELGEKHEDGFFAGGCDTEFACKAATDLWIDACALVSYPEFGGEYAMVIGADNSQAAPGDALDYTVGAGATAYIFGRRDVIATLDHYVSYTSDTPDFYRREHEKYPRHGGRFTGQPAYFKHVLTSMRRCMEKAKVTPKDIDYVVCHSPNAQFPLKAALDAGFEKKQVETGRVAQWIGNLYSGSCPTSLAAVLDVAQPGDRILLTAYGSGAGSDTYIFTVTPKIEEKRDRLVPVKQQIESPHKIYVDYNFYRKMKDAA